MALAVGEPGADLPGLGVCWRCLALKYSTSDQEYDSGSESSDFTASPLPLMRFSNDPSEEMILQDEWRRERMHQAVNDVESDVQGEW